MIRSLVSPFLLTTFFLLLVFIPAGSDHWQERVSHNYGGYQQEKNLVVHTLTSQTEIKVFAETTEDIPISEAMVFLDNRYVGSTDETGWLTISNVSPGDHTIKVVKEGFVDFEGIYATDSYETLYLKVTMEKPINWPYLVGIMLGVIITVGGGIIVVKHSREEKIHT